MAWPNPPATWATDQVVSASDLNTQLRDALIAVLPIGTLIVRVAAYSEVEVAVEGRWLQCNGVAVSRTTYSLLFDYLNALTPALPFGSGDSSTTFNVPDLRGRAVYAQGTHADVDVLGDSDAAGIDDRSPSHHHTETAREGTGGSSVAYGGNSTEHTGLDKTSGNENLANSPAFLVVGSWFIKYT